MESDSRDELIGHLHDYQCDHEWEGSERDESDGEGENSQSCSEKEVHESEYRDKYDERSIAIRYLDPIDIARSSNRVDHSGRDEKLEDRVHIVGDRDRG